MQDIFEYLRGEIHNKNSQINELQDKLLALEDEKERQAVEHERIQQVGVLLELDEAMLCGEATASAGWQPQPQQQAP